MFEWFELRVVIDMVTNILSWVTGVVKFAGAETKIQVQVWVDEDGGSEWSKIPRTRKWKALSGNRVMRQVKLREVVKATTYHLLEMLEMLSLGKSQNLPHFLP